MIRSFIRHPAVFFFGLMAVALACAVVVDPSSLLQGTLGGLMLANVPVALPELKTLVESIRQGLEDFKKTNDERLKAIESAKSDTDFQAKLAAITTQLGDLLDMKKTVERLEAKANRAGLGGGTDVDPAKAEYRSAFINTWVRKGGDISELQKKAWSIGVAGDGGVTLPEEIDRQLEQLARDVSPMRQIATVRAVGTSDYKKLVNTNGIASGWVGEVAARPATSTSTFAEVPALMGELYANPQITQQMLDDSIINVEAEIVSQLEEQFAVAEGAAFVTGTGTNQPKGFLAYTTAATGDAGRAFGTLEHVPTGVAGDFAAANKADVLFALMAKLKRAYRAGSVWTMGKAMMFEIMQIKDANGMYLWQPAVLANGFGFNLLGYPIVEMEDMPVKAANSLSIAFGNFRRGYYVVDRLGTRMLRDPFTNKPYVGFYTTKRVGGMVVNSEAIKLVRFAVA